MTASIFNYQTLKVRLQKSTRTLFIKFNSDHEDNPITMETLFELESLLSWATTHVEVHTLFLESSTDIFSKGYDTTILKKLTIEKLSTFTKKLQKINQAIMLLPQTVIVDLQMGANNIAAELATACDIRIANRACRMKFNHASLGLVPCSGGIVQLEATVGHGNAKNWLLSGANVNFSKLDSTGYIFDSYNMNNRDEVIQNLLTSIHNQSPVSRIQTKLAVVECVREHIETNMSMEKQIAKAAMMTEDWKQDRTNEMPTQSMKTAIKLSLVQGDKPENLN